MEHTTELSIERLRKSIEQLGIHDHLCLFYRTQEEQFAAVIPYIRIGLEKGENASISPMTARQPQ